MKDMNIHKIDLHMHTVISDGTDDLPLLLKNVQDAGIEIFSITDHDAIRGGIEMPDLLTEGSPAFIRGVEFSCKDELGKYHILGYGYDPDIPGIAEVVEMGHNFRMKKNEARLNYLREEFGFVFPDEALEKFYARDNPGKPHIGNMMVELGYAKTKDEAIRDFVDRKRFQGEYVNPKIAIEGILASGGIPVLAHPSYGSGDDLIVGEEMENRLLHLLPYGLAGVEAYYSGFTKKLENEILGLAEKYELYVTAGSDYHGRNKLVVIGDNGLDDIADAPESLRQFLRDVKIIKK